MSIRKLTLSKDLELMYKYVKSNNNNSKFIHIVRRIDSVYGNYIAIRLMCGNTIGTKRKVSFMLSNDESPCKRCVEVFNLNNGE